MSSHPELEELLIEWEAGSLDDNGITRVREILKSDPEAQKIFLQLQMVNAALQKESIIGVGLSDSLTSERPNSVQSSYRNESEKSSLLSRTWVIAAVVLLLTSLTGRLVYLEFINTKDLPNSTSRNNLVEMDRASSAEATSQGVALITRLVDIEWEDNQKQIEVGDALTPGKLSIKSGYAQIEFFCGATVVLEGPAVIELASPILAKVESGKLRAQVPPAARGFSLEVQGMKVIDLGTEFGVNVTPEGKTDIQVFDGEVEVYPSSVEKRNLIAGQAITRSSSGKVLEAIVTPEEFVNISDLKSKSVGQQTERYERWKKWSDQIRKDPRLITYYAFEKEDLNNRKLRCSVLPNNSELDGAIVGANHVQGRWENKEALEFKRPADRVRVQIPGEYQSLTFSCWVKIDSLDRWFNSLFLTDNYQKGEPHWQILDTGELFFSVRVIAEGEKGPAHKKVLSPPFWNPSLSGRWLHLATTYDVDLKKVTHYLNGKILSSEVIPDNQVVTTTRIGRASIGNWSLPTKPDAHFAIRNLNGRIDEFALFSAALTEAEIKELYENGKP